LLLRVFTVLMEALLCSFHELQSLRASKLNTPNRTHPQA
jgi:hypothetical protein